MIPIRHLLVAVAAIVVTTWAASGQTYTVSTLPGSSLPLSIPSLSALTSGPQHAAIDKTGNVFFVIGNVVVKLDRGGNASVVAGGGTKSPGDNGPATAAVLASPRSVAVDSLGNLYILESLRVREVSNNIITTVAGNGTAGFSGDGGPAVAAQLNNPFDIVVDPSGRIYIAEISNRRVRMVANGVITTFAGNGSPGFSGDNGLAVNASIDYPRGLTLDSAGNVYIIDYLNDRIRKVANGIITTVAGGGVPTAAATFNQPQGIVVDSVGNLFIADDCLCVRKVDSSNIVRVAGNGKLGFSGDGGPALSASFDFGDEGNILAIDSSDSVYVVDSNNGRIRVLNPSPTPSINLGGVVPIYSPVPVIQPGSWISIYGRFLSNGSATWSGDFPTVLGGVRVTIDNKPAYLNFVSPTLINAQAPDDGAIGPVSVVVQTPTGPVSSTVTLAKFAPSLCLLGDGYHVNGVIVTPSGHGAYGGGTYDLVGPSNSFSFNTRPVQPGEPLVLFGVGFGPTSPAVPVGQVFNSVANTDYPVTVTIGGVPATVLFSGITEAGLYQINVTVPYGLGSGDKALQATVSGFQTPPGPVVTLQ